MNFATHPLCQLVNTFSIHSIEYHNAARMATELETRFEGLAAMQPDDLSAIDSLQKTSQLMASIDQAFGSVHGWTRSQHARIYTEAVRLLGPQQTDYTAPNWVEL